MNLTATLVTDVAGFAALEHEWDELHSSAGAVAPQLSWAWLFSWWECHGACHALRIMVLRDSANGLLVGVVPLMIGRRHGVPTLLFITDDDPLDVLARDGWGPAVERAVATALRRVPGWLVADLRDVAPGSRMWEVARRWHGAWSHESVRAYSFVATAPPEQVLRRLGKNQRGTARKAVRRAAAASIHARPAPLQETPRAAATLLALHRELWAGRGISQSHASDEFARFLTTVVPRMAARGLADVVEWWQDGDVVISQLFLYDPHSVHAYQVGAAEGVADLLQWSSLCVLEGLETARRRGAGRLGLDRGDEPYKARWAPTEQDHHRIRLGRYPMTLLGHLALRRAGSAARRVRRGLRAVR